MKVFVKGKGEISLSPSSFVARGGQASVYQKSGTAYKIYEDPASAIPEAKFVQLAAIQDPSVVKPRDLLLDNRSTPIGYTMDYMTDSHGLALLFTKAFRDRNNVGHDQIRKLVDKLQEHVHNVHRAGVLIVDLNELNVLVSKKFEDVALIDVDSYQTPGFPATVLMPSVRDYSVSSKQFSELSDWFSFAVLTCQLFLGIHPYKGSHAPSATVASDKRLEHRMRNRISVFDKEVKLPGVCNSFDVIPEYQRIWLRAVLQEGKRLPPPPPGGGSAVVVRVATAAPTFGGQLTVTQINVFKTEILSYCESGSDSLALTQEGFSLNGVILMKGAPAGTTLLGFTPKMGRAVALNLQPDGRLNLFEISERRMTCVEIAATEIAKSGDRFYLRNGTRVIELGFVESTSVTTLIGAHPVAIVMENSSKLFDGVAIQSMLGSVYVSLFPSTMQGYQVRIPELDAYKIIEARFERGVLMVVGARGGAYDRLIFRFGGGFTTYDALTLPDVAPTGMNFVVTASGIVISLAEDEKLHAFSGTMGRPWHGRVVDDPAVGGDMRLTHVQGRVGFVRGHKVFTMGLK